MSEALRDSPPLERKYRVWLGVTIDICLTFILVILGFDPAYEVVTRHRHESALVLGTLHMVMVPAAILTAMVRADKLKLLQNHPGRWQQFVETMLVLFYVLGWLMPILMFAQRTNVPSWMIAGCIVSHVAPIIATVVLAIFKRAHWMDQLAFWISRRWEPQAVVYGVYLAGTEVFLMFACDAKNSFGPMPLLIWAGAYLPTRLLLAQISGLRGPERWTFALANVHLLVRLVLAMLD
jgi:hypothetical protein